MSSLSKWFTGIASELGFDAATKELLNLYDDISDNAKQSDPISALNWACREKGSVKQSIDYLRKRNLEEIRHQLSSRYNVISTEVKSINCSTATELYEYVSAELTMHAHTKADLLKLDQYCNNMSLSVTDVIYTLIGAVLHANMHDNDAGRVLLNLSQELCMRCKGTLVLHQIPVKPSSYQYTELHDTGYLMFNGLDFYAMIDALNNLRTSMLSYSDKYICDYFCGTPHSIEDCILLAEQYQGRAGVLNPLSLKDARLSRHFGESRVMHLISVYAEGMTDGNEVALSIVYTLAIQLILLYGKRYKFNLEFFAERKDGLSYAEISKLLLIEEE